MEQELQSTDNRKAKLPKSLPDGEELGELTVMEADDPALGLTNIGEIPPDDWAADTGPAHSAEEEEASRRR